MTDQTKKEKPPEPSPGGHPTTIYECLDYRDDKINKEKKQEKDHDFRVFGFVFSIDAFIG
jgi:hypothetical protein